MQPQPAKENNTHARVHSKYTPNNLPRSQGHPPDLIGSKPMAQKHPGLVDTSASLGHNAKSDDASILNMTHAPKDSPKSLEHVNDTEDVDQEAHIASSASKYAQQVEKPCTHASTLVGKTSKMQAPHIPPQMQGS
jgi:hypothetical protein